MTASPLPSDSVLLDASVWLAALDSRDRFHDAARSIIRSRPLLALDLTLYEVANVAVRSWRDAPAARALVDLVLGSTVAPPIAITGPYARAAIAIAQRRGLTVYDASYAAVAHALERQLVSCDVRDLVGKGLAAAPDRV